MKLNAFSAYDLRVQKFVSKSVLADKFYMQADENDYFIVYNNNGMICCWKILDIETLTADDWEIVKEPGF